ncbi:hypothetical protein CJF42_15230 [Pseudoalteromonas sp. NBT06-2]|nr:hypothetical protein CJF42_15230 [Pseudoalteromonas sp. NBT06-2]
MAIKPIFSLLTKLEDMLNKQRFLLGEMISESDCRLFVTLVRFDIDYFIYIPKPLQDVRFRTAEQFMI